MYRIHLSFPLSPLLLCSPSIFYVLSSGSLDLRGFDRHEPFVLRMQEKTGCDVVTGSRYIKGGGVFGWNLKRKITSRGANILAQTLLQIDVFRLPKRDLLNGDVLLQASDLTGSFRLFRKECLVPLLAETKSKVSENEWDLRG